MFVLASLGAMSLMPSVVSADSIAAWFADGLMAPQILMYEEDKGRIFYSLCNSNGTPIFPYDDEHTLQLYDKPMKNTTITGSSGSNGSVLLWYQHEQGGIAHAIFACNTTGHLNLGVNNGVPQSWIVTGGQPVVPSNEIQPGTDLAALTFGQKGHRVYYKSNENLLSSLEYRTNPSNPEEGNWAYGGELSQNNFSGPAIAASAIPNGAISVIIPGEREEVDLSTKTLDGSSWNVTSWPYHIYADINSTVSVSNYTAHNKWHFDGRSGGLSPEPLDSFSHNESDIAIAHTQGSDGLYIGNIFYIGEDFNLHHLYGSPHNWTTNQQQQPEFWPPSSAPWARLAAVGYGLTKNLWIYYKSGGQLVQVHQRDGQWQKYVVLPKFNATAPDTSTGEGSAAGLSGSQKIGVGVGVGLGGLVLLAVAAFFVFRFVKRSRQNKDQNFAAAQGGGVEYTPENNNNKTGVHPSNPGSPTLMSSTPAPGYTSDNWGDAPGQWINGQWVPSPGPYGDVPQAKQGEQWQQHQGHNSAYSDNRFSHLSGFQPVYEMGHEQKPQELQVTQLYPSTAHAWEMGGNEIQPDRNGVSPPPLAGSPPLLQPVSPIPTGTVSEVSAVPAAGHHGTGPKR